MYDCLRTGTYDPVRKYIGKDENNTNTDRYARIIKDGK